MIGKRKPTQSAASDHVINFGIATVMFVASAITLYPLIYSAAVSFSTSTEIWIKPVTFYPIGFTLENYRVVFRQPELLNAFIISGLRVLTGIPLTLVVSGAAAYALSKYRLPFMRLIGVFIVVPMYFSGGMITEYVNMAQLGLLNKFMVYILPHAFVTYYILIMRSFFYGLPESLEESARIEGASVLRIFVQIIVPLSGPILATVALFHGVWEWNQWFDARVYVYKKSLQPIQVVLQNILQQNDVADMKAQAQDATFNSERRVSTETLTMAMLVITIAPIVTIYPFLQKYFVKGALLGAVKE